MTFAEWADRWEATMVDLHPTTRALNLGVVGNYLLPRFGRWPLSKITTADVKTMVAEESAGELSPSAVRRHAIILGTILGGAVDDGADRSEPGPGA